MAESKPQSAWGSFVIPVGMIAWGAWKMYSRQSAGVAVGWWPWVLIGFGVLGVLLSAVPLVLGEFAAAAESPRQAGAGVAELYDRLYCGKHEYRPATDADLRGLDRRFYESATAALQAAGYRQLGDVVDVTSANATSWARAVIRVMVSGDGVVTAGIYHVRFSGFPRLLQIVGLAPRNTRFVSLETELADGTYVTTTNDREANQTSEFPGVARLQLGVATPPDVLVAEHGQNLRHVLSCNPGVRPRAFRTLREVLESQNRLEELKSAHRASPDFDMESEVERIAGEELTDDEREMASEAARLRRRGRTGPGGAAGRMGGGGDGV